MYIKVLTQTVRPKHHGRLNRHPDLPTDRQLAYKNKTNIN